MRRRLWIHCLCYGLLTGSNFLWGEEDPGAKQPYSFTRVVTHWSEYDRDDYLPFLEEAKPDIAQVGYYGAHFCSLATTPYGKGYPAHFPVQGYRECSRWFDKLNQGIHQRGVKAIGHFNVMFLIGDPETAEGPRGFFKFYRDDWEEAELGPRPVEDPTDLLERNRDGTLISSNIYRIGGMQEYWACLRNPHWRAILKAWVRFGIKRGLDGFIINYYYRHDCQCDHCIGAFKNYLSDRFTPAQLAELFGITDLEGHAFDDIVSWHSPESSTPLKREALRFSQITNKQAFDEVFVKFGRSLKPDLIVAQWNHLGDFSQIEGDEKCMLPGDLWSRDEDYLWYSLGGVANFTRLKEGFLGEGTLQARYVRGASGDKSYTLGKYEGVRIRASIAELAANGGAPMGFYTWFNEPEARKVITAYYRFLERHDSLYQDNRSHGEVLLLFPRSSIHAGDLAPRDHFRELGQRLLNEHVLFDILPDDMATPEVRQRYSMVVDAKDRSVSPATLVKMLPPQRSHFDAPGTVRVSASRPAGLDDLTLHLVNYNRVERGEGGNPAGTIADEKPVAAQPFTATIRIPAGFAVARIDFLTPEASESQPVSYESESGVVKIEVPSFLVYGVVTIQLENSDQKTSG